MRLTRSGLALAVVVAVLAASVAACGDDDGGEGGTSASNQASTTGADSSNGGGGVEAEALATVSEFESSEQDWPKPPDSFDAGTGKAVVISCGNASESCALSSKEGVEAFKAMGWDVGPPIDGEFSPQKQAAAVDRAVQQKADIVLLVAVNVSTIKAAVDRALDAGVMIACSNCDSGTAYADKIIDTRVDFSKMGEANAAMVLSRSGDDAKVVHFQDQAYSQSTERAKGFKDAVEAACDSCEVELRDIATASITKPGPPEFTALLSARPKGTITDYVASYDGYGLAAAKTAKGAGRDDFSIYGYDGEREAVTTLAAGSNPQYVSSAAIPYAYLTWAAADLAARRKAGAEEWAATDMPVQLITEKNAAKFADPYTYPAPDGDWRQEFSSSWGK